jgi:hypothetical protein
MTTTADAAPRRGGTMRVVRSRGALSGFLVLLLGVWGALIPFVGPYFDYAYSPAVAWTWTSGRFWLEVLPGIAAVVAGFLLMTTANRSVGVFAGWLASLAGAWFVVGPVLGRLWNGAEGAAGTPVGGTARQVWEQIGFFDGLGAVILFLGALALGRFTVTSVRDLRAAERARGVAPAETAPAAAAPVAATPATTEARTAPATTFRDNRVEETRVVKEPVGARAGRSEGVTQADTTRPVETARTETARTETTGDVGAHSEEARQGGLMGRMRDRVRSDRTAGTTTGSTRNDALDTPRD